VSGCSAASSACDVSGGGSPLSVSISWNGANPYIAAGASGVCSSYTDGGGFEPNVLIPSSTGGTLPYVSSVFSVFNDPSGKIGLGASPDTVHTTLTWAGFSVNETESVNVNFTVTDSLGAVQTGTCGPILIKRTS
jgi:hypothetical protein